MTTECALNADRMSHECWANDVRMLANLLMDIELIHRNGHMDPAVFGATVSLIAIHMDRVATECTSNAD